jgi:RHS repeat-associated protein
VPAAYVKYIAYDTAGAYLGSEYKLITRQALNNWQQLTLEHKAQQDGYVEVFLANESGEDVYFDDMMISSTPLDVQENHYDPWGLNLVGIERAGNPDHKFQYNGKEKQEELGLNWMDYGARMYDAQLGRWRAVDPLADLAPGWTPYRAFFNNPVNYVDLTGLFETRAEARTYKKEHDINGRIQKGKDGVFSINDKGNNVSYFKDSSLDDISYVSGRGEDGVIQSALTTSDQQQGSNLSEIDNLNNFVGGVNSIFNQAANIGLKEVKTLKDKDAAQMLNDAKKWTKYTGKVGVVSNLVAVSGKKVFDSRMSVESMVDFGVDATILGVSAFPFVGPIGSTILGAMNSSGAFEAKKKEFSNYLKSQIK